jgi:O-antigen/teichoic acid export membrane protein
MIGPVSNEPIHLVNTTESTPRVPPMPSELSPPFDPTGADLKKGALLNTVAMLTSNFRAIFTLLVARLLGPASLGIFSVVWATTDLFSKIGVFGLDDAVTTFIARANAAGEQGRARALFRIAIVLATTQSIAVAVISIIGLRRLGNHLRLEPEMVSALTVVLGALPSIALYRISTSVSRGMKVMKHDIYSRGITESVATTLAFLIALSLGFTRFGPELAAIAGTTASGIVALVLATRLFRHLPPRPATISIAREAQQLVIYALPISADQFLNAFIWRVDVIMLGWFVGRAPGVTLTGLGIYGAVVGLANGLRRVSQAFTPIFVPVVAGMTAMGEQRRAAETYARLAQWMLWILLPLVGVLILAGGPILRVFGPAFEQGSVWLGIVAVACATNAFINLGETVIMVQRPGLNVLNSLITCTAGVTANLCLIPRFGVLGAAVGILFAYLVQGAVRSVILRFVFHWPNPWPKLYRPVLSAIVAAVPALLCRFLINGTAGQIISGLVFLVLSGLGWMHHLRSSKVPR